MPRSARPAVSGASSRAPTRGPPEADDGVGLMPRHRPVASPPAPPNGPRWVAVPLSVVAPSRGVRRPHRDGPRALSVPPADGDDRRHVADGGAVLRRPRGRRPTPGRAGATPAG